MKIWPIINAPLVVQLNRTVFAIYATFFIWIMWETHRTASPKGWITFFSFLFFSIVGIFYSCVRARRSQWIMSVIVILIPSIVVAEMFYMEIFSTPAWWEWLLLPLNPIFSVPAVFAISLFKDKKARDYFTKPATP